jgi:peptidoglycan hydrolase-like protein with peptidoglycan-binding domain
MSAGIGPADRPAIEYVSAADAADLAADASAAGAAAPPGYDLLDPARHGRYLRRGSHGDDVRALQRALAAAGVAIAETGIFDGATESAVRSFQRTHGCTPDGIVGPQTLGALDRALGLAPGGPAPAPAPAPGPGPAPAPGVGGTTLDAIPPRRADAPTGSEFLRRTAGLGRAEREEAIFREIAAGNVPDFERRLADVTTSFTGPDGRVHTATYRVLPDYLAIGSDDDFVRIPMSPTTAQRLADLFGASLPTKKMVDDIYRAAPVKLAPIPLPPGPQMMSNGYYLTHNERVEAARAAAGGALGELTAGTKKDVVISNRLAVHPGHVAIYGWHKLDGRPIQPLSTVHEAGYADYSHGIRLVAGTVRVDGRDVPIDLLLRDPTLSRLLSDEGPIAHPRYP